MAVRLPVGDSPPVWAQRDRTVGADREVQVMRLGT